MTFAAGFIFGVVAAYLSIASYALWQLLRDNDGDD